ncbi:hypothetical protein COO60DRAFT_1459513 [Scenedesmus sp. NREL 46B-D3]|nr:hypothetical protein COO60DRAFT_1459513 [Scenedesmus sp. NREL 46B-D3]
MQSCDGSGEDAALLLTIKDAEISTLRQQMAQLADDLKRNLAVLATKDEDGLKLRNTVDGLRAVLAEKDSVSKWQNPVTIRCSQTSTGSKHSYNPSTQMTGLTCQQLFTQFQAQVQELELLRLQESEQRLATEQLLAAKHKEWTQQLEAGQQGKEAEVVALQQQLKDSEEKWLEQLMQARQTALDESMQRSTQQQSALEREAEHVQRLQQQLDMLGCSLSVKEAEIQAAHRQLGSSLEATQTMEVSHAQAVSAKDALIAQLKQQLEQQASSIAASTGDHEINMAKLIKSINEMQQSCQAQALEVQEYASAQKRLQDERRVLREQMRHMEGIIIKVQTEKGVLEAALQHGVTAQAGAQAQLNIFQAKLTEAVVELEKRCAAAETRSTKLMSQLVEERGRLVDAVIEQANSSTPQLAAELAKSLEVSTQPAGDAVLHAFPVLITVILERCIHEATHPGCRSAGLGLAAVSSIGTTAPAAAQPSSIEVSRAFAALAAVHPSGTAAARRLLQLLVLGQLLRTGSELVAAAGTAGTSTAALAAAGSSAFRAGGGGEREQFGSRRGSSAIGAANAALSREQLRRLAELSPGRQRLLRALAAANTK